MIILIGPGEPTSLQCPDGELFVEAVDLGMQECADVLRPH